LGGENRGVWELPGRNDRVCLLGDEFLDMDITMFIVSKVSYQREFPKSSRMGNGSE
jgi:hypothetical protein